MPERSLNSRWLTPFWLRICMTRVPILIGGVPQSFFLEGNLNTNIKNYKRKAPNPPIAGGEVRRGAWPCAPTPSLGAPKRCRGRACPTLVGLLELGDGKPSPYTVCRYRRIGGLIGFCAYPPETVITARRSW